MVKKKQRALFNAIVGVCSQLIIVVLGFVIPKIMMDSYGSDVNGLVNSITQIFGYLSLLEAGMLTAATNAYYKPLAQNNDENVSIVASISKAYYKKISYIYFYLVVGLSFILPLIINTNVDYWSVFLIIFFEGLTSIVSFYFIQKWRSLLVADSKIYVYNSVFLMNKVCCQVVKIVLACLSINIIFLQMGYFLISIIQVLILYAYMRRQYRWVDYNIKTNYSLPNRNAYLLGEVSQTIYSSTDLLILSIFVSSAMSSVYSIYNLPISSFSVILNAFFTSVCYVLGQSNEKSLDTLKKNSQLIHSILMIFVTTLSSVTCLLMIPFVKLYTAGVNDINYIINILPFFFCTVLFGDYCRKVSNYIVNLTRYSKQNSIFLFISAVLNIIFSIILVQFLDIFGVILGTVLSAPFAIIPSYYYANKKVLNKSMRRDIVTLLCNFSILIISGIIAYFAPIPANSILSFIIYGLILTVLILLITFIVNCFLNTNLLKTVLTFIKRSRKSKND